MNGVLAAARSVNGELLMLGGDAAAALGELQTAEAAQLRMNPDGSPLLEKTQRRLAALQSE